jgi:hypothetical protein
MAMRTGIALYSLLLALAGCASAGAPYRAPFGVGRSPLYPSEMERIGAINVYEAIERLRPMYFHDRGPSSLLGVGGTRVQVFVNDMHLGGVSVLRTIPAGEVTWIRYLSPSEATVRYGSRGGGGAIVVWVGR